MTFLLSPPSPLLTLHTHPFLSVPLPHLPSPPLRYELMKAYMPTVGTMGLDMMFRTCTVQVWKGWEEGEGGSQRGGT